MKKKIKQIRAASKKSKLSMLAVFVFAFAGIGGLIVLQSRAATGLCSTTGVIGTATYNVTAPETATYRLWVRMQVPDTTNTGNINGVRVELAGSSNQCFTVTTASASAVNQWQWVNSDATIAATPHITNQMNSGNYTAKILGLKAGVKVDKVILLRSDNTCIPSNDLSNGQPGDNCTTPAPVVALTANPTTVVSGGSVTLTWTVSGSATGCTASGTGTGWTGAKSTSGGTQTLTNRTATQTYSLTCSGVGGSGADTETVTVTAAPVPTVTLTANPTSVVSGNPSALTWTTTNVNVNGCTASGSWTGTKAASGTQSTGNLTANQTYNLSCTGPGGTANASATVTVTATPPPTDTTVPSVTFNIPGVTLTTGQTTVLVREQKGVTWQPIATDNVGVTSLTLTVNGQVVTGSSIQVGVSANGDYVVEAIARDAANNTTTKTLTIQVRHPDFNRSGTINIADVSALLNRWNTASTIYDINVNGRIDIADLSYVLNRWGSTQ
jgi:hypothetical protein